MSESHKSALRNRIVQIARENLPKNRERQHTEKHADGHRGWVCYPISDVEIAYIDAIAQVLHEANIE